MAPPPKDLQAVHEGGTYTTAALSVKPESAPESTARVDGDRRALWCGILATAAAAIFGFFSHSFIVSRGLAKPLPLSVFFRLYALYEQPFLYLLLLTAVVVGAVAVSRDASADAPRWWSRIPAPSGGAVLWFAAGVTLVSVFVWRVVLHAYPLAMDEFTADFQAKIFASGHIVAALPAAWRPFGEAVTPIFVGFHPATGNWVSEYLPVYSALKAPFELFGAGGLLNPVLAGLSIVAIAAIGRRLWPDERFRPWLAIALLATSSEFLVTSGSQYSMPAHLLFNLVWLWLYLRGDSRSWAGALVVGALALGLHNPFPHALFVAPFLVRLLRERRWGRVAAAAAVYGGASLLWLAWLRAAPTTSAGGLLTIFSRPNLAVLWLQATSVSLLFTWQAPVFGLLVTAALIQWRRLSGPERDLAWGVGLTLAFYLFFPYTQGHGWGDRYAYQVLGNLAILGALGGEVMRRAIGPRRTSAVLATCLSVALLVEAPVRFADADAFSRPFARAAAYVHSIPAAVVVVHPDSLWYGVDLVRNDPFLQDTPVIVHGGVLTPSGLAILRRAFGKQLVELPDSALIRAGLLPMATNGR